MLNKIQLIFKPFLILLIVDTLILCPVFLFLEIRFLIPSVAVLFLLHFIFFFSLEKKILNALKATKVHSGDRYGVFNLLKEEREDLFNVDIFISHLTYPFSLSCGNIVKSYIVFSEHLWNLLSEKEKKMLILYHLFHIKKGWTLTSTLISHFFHILEKQLYFMNAPLLFKKRKANKPNKPLLFCLKMFGMLSRRNFIKKDHLLVSRQEDKKTLALLLWKIQSLYQLQDYPLSLYFTPLLPSNPLTSLKKGCYISLQPSIKSRVRSLVGDYPP